MAKQPTNNLSRLLPVLFTFFVMGFCDIVGVVKNHMTADGLLTDENAGNLSFVMFCWFLLSVPFALMMNRIGRKTTVQVSNIITIVGMVIPIFMHDAVSMLTACALLGFGNTILQVSLNPLMSNVVKGDQLASSLTTGQFIKAISSFVGAPLTLLATSLFGQWYYVFPIFAAFTLVSAVWLQLTRIEERAPDKGSTLGGTFALLGDRTILLLFLGIIAVVGIDVGMNMATPSLLKKAGVAISTADFGSTVYFLGRTAGTLVGAILLARISEKIYFRAHILLALAGVVAFYFLSSSLPIFVTAAIIAFGISSIFAVIFSQAMKARPDKGNEISGLMITGVFGGAIVGPVCNLAVKALGGDAAGSVLVIGLFALYLTACSLVLKFK
ncbi:MFS transporter [Bacteroidia bacterium]|nr:MFS transporter [Bacteroidia bacterium]